MLVLAQMPTGKRSSSCIMEGVSILIGCWSRGWRENRGVKDRLTNLESMSFMFLNSWLSSFRKSHQWMV